MAQRTRKEFLFFLCVLLSFPSNLGGVAERSNPCFFMVCSFWQTRGSGWKELLAPLGSFPRVRGSAERKNPCYFGGLPAGQMISLYFCFLFGRRSSFGSCQAVPATIPVSGYGSVRRILTLLKTLKNSANLSKSRQQSRLKVSSHGCLRLVIRYKIEKRNLTPICSYTHTFLLLGMNVPITQDICYTGLSGRNSFV